MSYGDRHKTGREIDLKSLLYRGRHRNKRKMPQGYLKGTKKHVTNYTQLQTILIYVFIYIIHYLTVITQISCLFFLVVHRTSSFLSVSGCPQVYLSSQVSLSTKCPCSIHLVLPPLCIFHSALLTVWPLRILLTVVMPMILMLSKPLTLKCQKGPLFSAEGRRKPPSLQRKPQCLAHHPLGPQSNFFTQLFQAPSRLTALYPT